MSLHHMIKEQWEKLQHHLATHNVDGGPANIAQPANWSQFEDPVTMPEDGDVHFEQPKPVIGDIRLTDDDKQEYFDGKKWIKQDPNSQISMLKSEINSLSARLHNMESRYDRISSRVSQCEDQLSKVRESEIAENEGSHLV